MKRVGKATLEFELCPAVAGYASVAGKMESEGPLGRKFDEIEYDSYGGCETYEDAEMRLQSRALSRALEKTSLRAEDIDCVFAGDLLNQCVGSSFGLKEFNIPFLGQYGACSTMAQNLITASVFVDSGAAKNAACVTSSHFCSAERQYRFPLEYGGVRTPTAQWTVTGAGACVLSREGTAAELVRATVGRIVDLDVTDANNMGAAMAPAAAQTISQYFADTGTMPKDYDLILTGDLGEVGSGALYDLLAREGIDLSGVHNDCGLMIFDRERQDVHAGGSGCGCCASVLCSQILSELENGVLKNILFIATGALLSTTTAGQQKSIPSIAHLVNLRSKQ